MPASQGFLDDHHHIQLAQTLRGACGHPVERAGERLRAACVMGQGAGQEKGQGLLVAGAAIGGVVKMFGMQGFKKAADAVGCDFVDNSIGGKIKTMGGQNTGQCHDH